MSANRKQIGSNLISAEAYTGRCPIRCECCYVNFGRTGRGAAHGLVHDDKPSSVAIRDYARKHHGGWDGGPYRIWTPPKSPWYNEGPRVVRLSDESGNLTGHVIPLILRVSSMSDSSVSPKGWCEDIQGFWEGSCFFNSTIRAIRAKPQNLIEVFRKIVVTMNGGFQRVYEYDEPTKGRSVAKAQQSVDIVRGSMSPKVPSHDISNFLEPHGLEQIGLADQEHKVKFYRLRALPTIEPPIPQISAPVVHTILRFKGVADACEFARKYGLELRYEGNDAFHRAIVRGFEFEEQRVVEGPNRIFIRGADVPNDSPHRDEWSELVSYDSFWRVSSKEQLSHLPFVCDRTGNDCKACGLCATLDGTEPGDQSPIMAEYGYRPEPYAEHFVDVPRVSLNPGTRGTLSGTFFRDILMEACIHGNPASGRCEFSEQDDGWIADALAELGSYVTDEDYYNQTWDTHEGASSLLEYCFWALARKARRNGMSLESAWRAICLFGFEATGGVDLFSPNADLMIAWDGFGPVVEQFGALE